MESVILEVIITSSLFLLLCCTGMVLNIVLLIVFAKHPETRTPENLLLIHLCISDIAYMISFLSFITTLFRNRILCMITIFVRSFLVALNVYSVVAISIHRYIGLREFRNRLITDKNDYSHSLRILGGVWVTASVLAAVEVILSLNARFCFEFLYSGLSLFRMLAYALVPSVLILVFYNTAACRIRQSVGQLPNAETNATLESLRERRRKSARILFALAVVFALTYVPFYVYLYLWDIYLKVLSEHTWLTLTVYITAMLNPVFNPIALCVASTQLRELYKKYCSCCCQRWCASASSTLPD